MNIKIKDKKKEAAEEQKTVSYFKIFKHATWYEALATLLGAALGFLSAGGVCINLVLFGELSTAFVQRTAFQQQTSSRLPLLSLFGGGRILSNASNAENMAALMEDGAAIGVGMAATVVVSMALCYLSVKLINWSAFRQIKRIRLMFLKAILRQDMSWFDTDTSFNLASRMSEDIIKLKDGMGEKIGVVANLVGTAVISFCQAFPLGWELTLTCMSVLPFSVAAAVALSNYQTRSSTKEMNAFSKAGKQAEEVLKSVRTVVAFGGEDKEVERYKGLLEPAETYGCKRGLYNGLGTGFNWLLTFTVNSIGLAYGTRLVMNDVLKPPEERDYIVGNVFSILFSVYMATQSITFCVPHGETFAAARAAAANIFDILEREPVIDSLDTTGLCPRMIRGEITIENVDFSYPSRPDVKILKGFSLHIKPGETVALVGSSGCGKSTILQLVQRLYDPKSGDVKLDGRSIKSLNIQWLRSSIGVVGQEPVLFHGTISENISITAPEATQEEIQRVAEIAYAHDFIMKLPDGYNTVIGERGASLSGGQAQRVAIARALLREPAVLLLDEATSALDPASERRVQAALDRASHTRTTLTVSHRLSTIVKADRIICMDQGAIVEMGTHEELMNKKGVYWKLVTTGVEVKEPDVIETVLEEEESGNKTKEVEASAISRTDIKRHSSKRLRRRGSVRRKSHDWMAPRNSIASVISEVQSTYYGEDEVEDDEEIKPVGSWELLKQNGPEWLLIVVGTIAAFLQGACFPAISVIIGYAVGMFNSSDYDAVVSQSNLLVGLFIAVAAVAAVAMCLQSSTFTSAGLKMTTRLRLQYFSSLLRQEMGYYDKEANTVGALCSRLSNDVAEVQGATGLRIGLIMQGFSSVFLGAVIGFYYNWKMTLVGCAFLPLMVGSIWFEGRVAQTSAETERTLMESAAGIATEAVVSIKTVQSLAVETVFLSRLHDKLTSATEALTISTRFRGLVLGMGIYVPFMSYVCAVVYGVHLVSHEGESYSVVLTVTQSVMYGAYMLGHSLVYAPNFNSAKASGSRILSTINRVPKVKTEDGVKDRKDWSATGNFALKNVEFSYPTRPHIRVLKGLDLSAAAGSMVALVGASGCGKSTVLQLLQRFYDPDSGTIELDGRDIHSSLTLSRLRRQLGVVQQQPVLLERSLADNIAYGDNSRKVSMHEIVAAAKQANIHKFIVSLPQGYNTNLGSGGAQLSGGQKQRVCIARALIRSPRLLLLDEATSALDASSEKAVSEALEAAAKGRTCITIAHRLSTIRDADLICVVHKGAIVEKGTHAELINLQGLYWKMNQGQNTTH
ncbi:multidrug resistance protein homolog 49 [Plutella xylostella]|uniref:multidrug resistance protein homolog 49 n=1 Tax=Plutella xylostella TaxID=51655 RepID=UPI00203264C1|nr:multidrug resistance protein homolog 49 [Plutella xylostella]